MKIFPVVLCGGSGSRLWPMSRGGYPKQYLKLIGTHSIVQQTALRLRGIDGIEAPIVITNNDQRFVVAEQLRQAGVTPSSIVLEPFGRNTTAAIAVAAHVALQQSADALLLVLPSDHVIRNEKAFRDAIGTAAEVAADEYLVTFGVAPRARR